MKCVIPGVNIKVFGRAIHSLAKIGEELYVEPQTTGVSFRTVNSARSAFASFLFGQGFFSHYDEGSTIQEPDVQDETIKCKVAMKGFLNAFKSVSALERNVERCKVMMDWDDAKLVVQLTCRYGIVKTFNIAFIECETLQAVYNKSSCPNRLSCMSRVLHDAVGNFQQNQEEVTFCFSPNKVIFKTYVDEPDPTKTVHTVVTLQPQEFESYTIAADCDITFCLKELRAVLAFTEPVNLSVKADFSEPGCPVILTVDNKPMFEGTFVLATLSQNSDTQASNRQETTHAHSRVHHTPAVNSQSKNGPAGEAGSSRIAHGRCDEDGRRRISDEISSVSVDRIRDRGVTRTGTKSPPRAEENHQPRLRPSPPPHSHITPATSLTPTVRAFPSLTPAASRRAAAAAAAAGSRHPPSPTTPVKHTHTRNGVNANVSQTDTSIPNVNIGGAHAIEVLDEEDEDEDTFPSTPPAKRVRHIFRRCFESTFDPHSIPGFSVILAEDSDEEDP